MAKQLDLKIAGRFRLVRRLGKGGFGMVYEALDLETDEHVAVKLEDIRIDPSVLRDEVETYGTLSNTPGVPRVYWLGVECDFNVAVIELLGPSLEDLFNYCSRKFSLKTTLMLADQMIPRLQSLHQKQVLHRDIKPENFLMGRGKSGNTVFVTDFGISLDGKLRTHYNTGLVGTARFASINGHQGTRQSAYDDLTSLGYMFVYFLRGSLPWQGLTGSNEDEKNAMIPERKKEIQPAELCNDLPGEFKKYFETIWWPGRPEVPKYRQLRQLFRNAFRSMDFDYDNVFDWTILKFLSQAN